DHRLPDARVVAEVRQAPLYCAPHPPSAAQMRGAVRGDLKLMPRSERRDPVPRGISTSAGRIDLDAVDGAAEASEIARVVPVFARSDVGGHAVAYSAQPGEILRTHGLLDPRDACA